MTDPFLSATLVVAAALLGLLIGSFANVVIWRVPRGESIVSPPSACPRCGAHLHWWQNVPLLSFLALRGRCAACGQRISWRYPLVEATTAVLFALVAVWVGPRLELLAFLYLGAIAVILTAIDLEHHRLPNAIVLPAYPVLLALFGLAALAEGEWSALLRALVGGASLFAFYLLVALISPRGMGMGDVKLAGVLGLALGWVGVGALIVGAFAAFVVGSLAGLALLVTRRGGLRTALPFGPWMFAGAAIGLVAGEAVAQWYLGGLALA